MLKFILPAVTAILIGTAGLSAPATAAEVSAEAVFAGVKQSGAATEYARYRGGRAGGFARGRRFGGRGIARGGYGRRGYYGGRGYGYRRGGIGAGAVLGGLAAGALIGGAIASQAAPQGDAVAYCTQRFRSYDPASGTYLGNDGARHPCP